MQEFILNYPYLLFVFVFLGMFISNIFPIMFVLLPELIIVTSIYYSTQTWISIYIIFVFALIWAILWETISFFIWKKLNNNFLYKFIKKEKIEKLKDIFTKHNKKSIIIWKMMPWITWLVPVFFWLINYDFKKFFLLNSIMIFYSLAVFYFSLFVWFSVFEKFFGDYIWHLFIFLILLFVFLALYNYYKERKWK